MKFFGFAGAAIAVPVALTVTSKTPHERIAEHLKGINAAWAEIYGEPPRVSEFNQQSKFVLIAGRLDDFS